MLSSVNKLLSPLGLKIVSRDRLRRLKNQSSETLISLDAPFEAACFALLAESDRIRIVQIGANDGKWGDPLFEIARSFCDRTDLLLCEPQPELVEKLTENYVFHPNVRVFQGAIGRPGSEFSFFRVRPEFWDSLEAPYLKEAPAYRAPTGLASLDREHLARNLELLSNRVDGSKVDPDLVIEEIPVELTSLEALLHRYPEMNPVDVLIVDVEGLDDQIIYDSVGESFKPKVLFFETQHLSPNEENGLFVFLRGFGYQLMKLGGNTLGVRA